MNKKNILVTLGFVIFVGVTVFLMNANYSYKSDYENFRFNQEREMVSMLEEKLELLEIFLQEKEEEYKEISSDEVFIKYFSKRFKGELDNVSYELAKKRVVDLGEDLIFFDENMEVLLTENISNVEELLEGFELEEANKTYFRMYYNYLYNETFMEIVFPVVFEGKKIFFATDINISEKRDPYFEEGGVSVFLIDEDKVLIARGEIGGLGDIMVQKIDTKNSNFCFEEGDIGEIYYYDSPYENYKGDLSIGAGVRVRSADWCLIVEKDFEENRIENNKYFNRIVFNSFLIVCLFLFSFLYFCFLVDCRKYFKRKNKNIKLFGYIIFSILFLVFYVGNICFFFNGCLELKLYDLIPDVVFVFIALFFLGFSFRIDKNYRNFFIFGFLFLVLQKIIEIPFQEYQRMIGIVNFFIWLPSLFLGFFGYILLLKGFSEVKIKNG